MVVREPGAPAPLVLRVRRVLRADGDGGTADGARGRVTGTWQRPEGTTVRGTYATALTAATGLTEFTEFTA